MLCMRLWARVCPSVSDALDTDTCELYFKLTPLPVPLPEPELVFLDREREGNAPPISASDVALP